jgi:single-strand DNA-binding protein
MILTGVITLGQDCELKQTAKGTSVIEVNGAYNTGYGDNKETQWLKGSMYGRQAEALAQYLVKGQKAFVCCNSVKMEAYIAKDGQARPVLKANIQDLELVARPSSGGGDNRQSSDFQSPRPARPAQQPNGVGGGFDDDLPF